MADMSRMLKPLVLDMCLSAPAAPDSLPPIASITIPTHTRVDALQRALISYIENCKQYGRSNDYVVVDNSPQTATRRACRDMLRALKARYDVRIRYAGLEEKLNFIEQLAARRAAPAEVVDFAFFDTEQSGVSISGTSRNALLLDTVGDLIVSVDDDTVCRVAAAPDISEALRLVCGAPAPFETWLYPDRQAALAAAPGVEHDLLGAHERVLGQRLCDCLAAFHERADVHLDQIDVRFLQNLASEAGRVAVSLNGRVGDCGWATPDYLFLSGSSFERLTASEAAYRALAISREVFRFVNCTTIANGGEARQSMFLGLDNRKLLPPFLPIGRGQDSVFGKILGKCFATSYAARLPWSLLHAPTDARSFAADDFLKNAAGTTLARLITMLIQSCTFGRAQLDQVEKLRRLGSDLEAIGRLPGPEFEEVVRAGLRRKGQRKLPQMEARLRSFGASSPWWAHDTQRFIDTLRRSLEDREAWVPYDLLPGRRVAEAGEMTQRLVCKFGKLLYWWPDLVECARDLRAREQRVTRPIF